MSTPDVEFNYICRFCLQREMNKDYDDDDTTDTTSKTDAIKLQSLYDFPAEAPMSKMNIAQIIAQTTSRINISPDDGLPQQICNSCLRRLLEVHKFQEMCIESERNMRKRLNGAGGGQHGNTAQKTLTIKAEICDDNSMEQTIKLESDTEEYQEFIAEVTTKLNFFNPECLNVNSISNDSDMNDEMSGKSKKNKVDTIKETKRPGGDKCSLSHCKKSRRNFPKLKLFKFPRKKQHIFLAWTLKCGFTEEFVESHCRKLFLCEDHFSEEQMGPKYLRRDSIPDRNLV